MAGVSGSNEVLHFLDKPAEAAAANERIKLWVEDTKAIHLRCKTYSAQQRPPIIETTPFRIIIECENKSEAMDGVGEWLMERQSDASGPFSPTPPFPLGKKEREIEEAIDGAGGGGATAAAADAHTSLAEAPPRQLRGYIFV